MSPASLCPDFSKANLGGRGGAGRGPGGVGLAEEKKLLARVARLPGPWEPRE